MASFDKNREGSGTREWSEESYNIQSGCKHNCLYCYARESAFRYKLISTHEQWLEEKIREKAVNRSWNKIEGIIMFPTTHDITPDNINPVITTLKNILTPGNSVLIVSKPHLDCIKKICEELSNFKDKILFRFTIGSLNEEVSKFWEPGAPLPQERLSALEYAFTNGFQTSVSMEPMLLGYEEAINVFKTVEPFITDTVWIGKMNRIRTRVDMSIPDNKFIVEEIENLQCNKAILELVKILKDEPKVRWKDSIKKVISESTDM